MELLNFFLFLIDAWKYIFNAIIHAVFIDKIKLFLNIFIRNISKIPLILYFARISIFITVLKIK